MKILLLLTLFFILSCQRTDIAYPTLPPEPDFTISKKPQSFYAGQTFSVVSNSSNTDEVEWDFGDGITSRDSITHHSYATEGVYQIVLNAKNSIAVKSKTISVHVKDSINNLLTGDSIKTWFLYSWQGTNNNIIDFDSTVCFYAQTFYKNVMSTGFEGRHYWGLKDQNKDNPCNNDSKRSGYYEILNNPNSENQGILIGHAVKVGYDLIVSEDRLLLKNILTRESFYYK